MSIEEVKRLNSDLQNDPQLKQGLVQAGPELPGVIAYANEKGYSIDEDDIQAYTDLVAENADGGALSEEELEKVAGGVKWGLAVKAITADGVLVYAYK
jgi:predicted ribosomally synthesized peptide with nif11-like leader